MSLSFPSNPTTNQTYSAGQTTWSWDGSEWALNPINTFVTTTSLTNTLNSYVTTLNLSTTLSSYATSSTLSSTLNSYVTNTSLTSSLASYVTSSTLSGYNYITTNSLSVGTPNSASGSGAISYSAGVFKYTPPDLTSYVTSTSLTSTLGSYVTGTNLTSTLGSYITSATFASAIGPLVSNTSLATTLSNYSLTADMKAFAAAMGAALA
jgi:hypothetical protein